VREGINRMHICYKTCCPADSLFRIRDKRVLTYLRIRYRILHRQDFRAHILGTSSLIPPSSKDPGPEDPTSPRLRRGRARLWFTPERGCTVTWLISAYYWSIGVLENRKQDKPPLGMESEINRVLSACALRDLDHHSNTPLPFSGKSHLSLTRSKGPDFLC
jgi:hypothetical protein